MLVIYLTGCQPVSLGQSQDVTSDKPDNSLIVDLYRQPDETIPIWPQFPPGGVPEGLNERYVERENVFDLPDRAQLDVTRPTLSIFKPETSDGSAMLLIPGGGYKHVVVEKEGFEGARWFNRQGVTVYVLSYRLPHQGWAAGPDAPLQDAQRALRMVRSRAAEDGIEVDRVMVMGFSAGGHLAGLLLTGYDKDVYEASDSIDAISARPDIGVLVYPVITLTQPFTHGSTSQNMVGKNAPINARRTYSVETSPPAGLPPIFLMHTSDDKAVPVENSLIAYGAFREAGSPVSLHIFDHGGHGFGFRGIDDDPLRQWPEMVMEWGRSYEIFKPKTEL